MCCEAKSVAVSASILPERSAPFFRRRRFGWLVGVVVRERLPRRGKGEGREEEQIIQPTSLSKQATTTTTQHSP